MKLFFYRRSDTQPNFGDELNLWLWERLMPGMLDEDERVAFLGIGTLINSLLPERVPNAQHLLIFGTGVGYKAGVPAVDERWAIYALRGPLSALKLGVANTLAITDAAVLLRRVYQPTAAKRYQFSYMPHFTQSIMAADDWQQICTQLGYGYIDARWPVERVLEAIAQTEVLLTEAMHGAIVADALRVPWVAVQTTPWLLPFKWLDWCLSVGVEYQPAPLTGLEGLPDHHRLRNIRGLRGSRTALRESWRYWIYQTQARLQLQRIAQRAKPTLSDAAHLEQLTQQLEAALERLKGDVATGRFAQVDHPQHSPTV